jgi:hypothetical protein
MRREEGSMASLHRRFALGAIALPFLFLVMSGLARANPIVVNTLDSGSESFPLCTLEDAVTAADMQSMVNGCDAGSGSDEIDFAVTGTIFTDNTLVVTDPQLEIFGPPFGTPAGPPPAGGIVIDGGGTHEIIDVKNTGTGDFLALYNLTLADGSITTANLSGIFSVGGAVNAEGTELSVYACSFVNNSALPSSLEGFGGAIFGGTGDVAIENSTFAGNSADNGGAVYSAIPDMYLSNVTFSGNSAEPAEGGGLAWNPGDKPTVNGTIVADSTTGGNCEGPLTDDGYNLSDDTSGCFTAGTSKNNVHNLNLDPLGLQNNGGPTETIALETGSEAISFDKHCVDFDDDVVTIDQRLYTRPNSPTFCDSGAYEHDALANIVLVPNSERLQLVHSGSPMSDQLNTAFTFIDNGPGEFPSTTCDAGNNALNYLDVGIVEGVCNELPDSGLFASMAFVQHTVNHQSYGTDYYTLAGPFGWKLSARIVALPTPAGACGEWTLNLELSALDLANLGLAGGNPFALIIEDDDDNAVCFNITNAVVGGQIVPPPTRTVRRGVRR